MIVLSSGFLLVMVTTLKFIDIFEELSTMYVYT